MAAHRAKSNIPGELRREPRWVRHIRKRPITTSGAPASCTDPTTWAIYRQARASLQGDGIGFVLSGDGITCIDLDRCLDESGNLAEWAEPIVEATMGSYIERSPSGRGLHILGLAHVERGRRLPGGIEVYGDRRFITVTGERWPGAGTGLADISHVIATLI